MPISQSAFEQLRSITAGKIMRALEKDGWERTVRKNNTARYEKDGKDIVIHFHPGKTYGKKLLKELLSRIGWNDEDLVRLKLIRRP